MFCSSRCNHVACLRYHYRNKLSSFSSHSLEDLKSLTFDTEGQRYVGPLHGRGGRVPNGDIRDQSYFKDAIFSCLANHVSRFQLTEQDFLFQSSSAVTSVQVSKIVKKIRSLSSLAFPNTRIEHLQQGIGFSTLHSSENTSFFHSDDYETQATKHAHCTWVTEDKKLICTCIGSSSFRANLIRREFSPSLCSHTETLHSFFSLLAECFHEDQNITWLDIIDAIFKAVKKKQFQFPRKVPTAYRRHSQKLIILYLPSGSLPDTDISIWAPIRISRRGGVKYICCFCENSNVQLCDHVRVFRALIKDDTEEQEIASLSEEVTGSTPLETTGQFSHSVREENSSFLPLSPISCIAAVKLDQQVCSLAKESLPFNVSCPLRCTFCGNERDESTRQIINDGIVHCSLGPCRMYLESFLCQSSSCRKRFIADGRENYICIRNTTSAVTHAFVRKECEAVALSAGTIRRRMELYLKSISMAVLSEELPKEIPSRSIKVLQNLCSLAISLMVKEPNPEFFRCKYCDVYSANQENDRVRIKRVFAVCVDGIRAGCSDNISFQSDSPECHPIPGNVRIISDARPRDGLLRKQSVITTLLLLLERKPVTVTRRSIGTASETLRLLDPNFNITSASLESICGRSKIDFSHDIGANSTISCIRNLLNSFFNVSAATISLMRAMFVCTEQCVRADTIIKLNPTKRILVREVHLYVSQRIPQVDQYQEPDMMWNPSLNLSSSGHFTEILQLTTALLSKSLPNFLNGEKSESFRRLIHLFEIQDVKDLTTRIVQFYGSPLSPSRNVLRWNRLLFDGLLSMIQCSPTSQSLYHIKCIMEKVYNCIQEFYIHNEELTEKRKEVAGSAAEYHDNWIHATVNLEANNSIQDGSDNLQIALCTGEYFPSLPKIRPHPFSEKVSVTSGTSMEYGPCSKDYSQKKNGFSHGAVTVCCSCSNPIIYGFKVLQKGEGPQAILNILLSRFENQPKYIIYDFACGLQRVALNCLWWSFRRSTFVSDAFHSVNHSCSRIFHPRSYKDLDMCNTVSHEQRNRPISELKKSFRPAKKQLYVSLLAYHILITNIHAQVRRDNLTLKSGKHLDFTDRKRLRFEDADLWYFEKGYSCKCCL